MAKASRDKGMRCTPKVEWRPVVGLPDYMVSEYGDVMRITRGKTRRMGHQPEGQMTTFGYRQYKLMSPDGCKVACWAHRLVMEAFVGPAPTESHQVAHSDGDPLNNQISNLRWATVAENADDKVRHGRSLAGRKNPNAKLDEERVSQVRSLYESGYGGPTIAKMMGIGSTTVYQIVRREHWPNVG